MLKKIEILNDDRLDEWDCFVLSHKAGSVYHTSLWRKVISESYRFKPLYLALTNDNGAISAGIPFFFIDGLFGKKLSSLPFAHYTDPLLSKKEDFDFFEKYINLYMKEKKIKICELKTSTSFRSLNEDEANKLRSGFCTHILSLGDKTQEEIFRTFHKNCIQRPIRKTEKNGLELKEGISLSDVRIFFKLYLKMRKKNGLLPQPYNFFKSLWKNLREKDGIEILHASYEGKIISSILLLKYKKTVIYEYGATLQGYVRLHPSHFLLWETIKRSKENGYEIFDFGRTSDDNVNLMLFKDRWGTKRLDLNYRYKPDIGGISKIRQANAVKNLMNIVIKIMPDTICHAIGKILYRIIV